MAMALQIRFLLLLALTLVTSIDYALARNCYQCSGINCQRTSYTKTVNCADSMDSCVSVFDGQITEIQGCLAELPTELRNKCKTTRNTINGFECHICNGELCNNFGGNDFNCIQCESKTDEKCQNSPEMLTSTRCPIAKTSNSYCFARIDNNNNTQRGCTVTQSEQRNCLDNVNCALCMPKELSDCNAVRISYSASNGSNNSDSTNNGSNNDSGNNNMTTITPRAKCHECSGINCQRTTYTNTVTCADPLDSCVTIFDGQSTEIQGCLEELPSDLRNMCKTPVSTLYGFECHICSGELCNNFGANDYNCIQCDSKTDEKCQNSPEMLTSTRCPIAKTSNSYCFARIDNNNITLRGCSVTQSEQRNCLDDVNCMLCMPTELSGCNAIRISNVEDDNDGSNSGNNNQTGGGESTNNNGSGSNDNSSSTNSGSSTEANNNNIGTSTENSVNSDSSTTGFASTTTSSSGGTNSNTVTATTQSTSDESSDNENSTENSGASSSTETDLETDPGNAAVQINISLITLVVASVCALVSLL